MREALTTTVSNRNQVDDDWSMQECLSRFLETEALKSEQSEALGSLISRREVIVILPTGFGKSLFFFFFSHLFCLAPSVKREKLFVVLDDRSIKFEWSRNWGNEVLKLSDHGRKTSTAAQTTRTKKTWPKKKSGILKGGVLMYDNQRKKELKKEYAPFLPA